MADEKNQQDPPWGRPVEGDQETHQHEEFVQPDAAAAEEAYHDGPESDEPTGAQQAQDASVVEGSHAEGEDPYQWHTGRKREHGSTDAVEFIDVVKAFGRNTVLNGLNLGLPEGQISMILGPSGTGKSVCIKHMVGLLYPDQGDILVHGQSVPDIPDQRSFSVDMPEIGTLRASEFLLPPFDVMVATPLAPVYDLLSAYRQLCVALITAMLLLSAAIGFGLSQLVLRPIRAIRETANRIRSDNLKERIPVDVVKDEIAELRQRKVL